MTSVEWVLILKQECDSNECAVRVKRDSDTGHKQGTCCSLVVHKKGTFQELGPPTEK